jgi:lipoate-protein ligase B
MNRLEEVLIRVLAEWGIAARRIEKLTGVWVGGEKIAAMGVRLLHGVTMHGFALNVDMDLSPFERILPCGIPGCRVTSMARILGMPVKVTDVRDRLAEIFAEVFSIEWMERHVSHGEDDAPAVASPSLEKIAIP